MLMGRSKRSKFSAEQNRIADIAKALAHPARVAILEYLAESQSCMVGSIVDVLPLAQATVSQHLAELKRIGLISGETEGPKICYCINREAWDEAKMLLSQFMREIKMCC